VLSENSRFFCKKGLQIFVSAKYFRRKFTFYCENLKVQFSFNATWDYLDGKRSIGGGDKEALRDKAIGDKHLEYEYR